MKTKYLISPLVLMVISFVLILTNSCKREKPLGTEVYGFEFFNKIPGLWHGPVSSTTSAGSFDNWYVDFRPVSENQISQFSLLDTNTVNIVSFFIVKFKNQLKVAMRTEGCFKNQCCVTYEVMDSVNEASGFYRFSDFVRGTKRAYTEFVFNNDAMTMKVYTNKFNTVNPLQPHSTWTATLGSRSNVTEATAHFSYPQSTMTRDFSDAFKNMTESIFFTFENDPYASMAQPYVGSLTAHISIDSVLPTDTTNKIFLLFTTKPLFNGVMYNADNLKYISKYVLLSIETSNYHIKDMHPGTYYVYSLIDKNHDNQYLSGDYMNSNFNNSITVLEKQDVNVNTVIDFVIP